MEWFKLNISTHFFNRRKKEKNVCLFLFLIEFVFELRNKFGFEFKNLKERNCGVREWERQSRTL